jgi:competence protein ComEC
VLVAAVAAGAWWSAPVPLGVAAGVALAGLAVRRPTLLVVGAALLASALGARAWAGLAPPEPRAFAGEVTLVGDPTDSFGAVQVEARVDGRRVQLSARGAAAGVLRDRLAGERVVVEGRLGPLPDALAGRLARRHVSGRLTVARAGPWRTGTPVHRLANGVRRTLAGGAAPLGEHRPLFTGMVLGDDREQPALVTADFRAAGLTHLLAVSGQNVAFVLVLARPLLSRLGIGGRWAATLAVLGFFALVTRFEPSVLRASCMAAVACTASGLGRPASRGRVLALAATAVLLLDPLLVGSVSFLLSLGASAGILALARPLAERIPGPRWWADVVAVTVAAQVGVAPVLVPVFGGIPVASLPANVAAVPVAGPLMVWGLTGGMVAGVVGAPVDRLVHLPTSWLVRWVAGVARWAADLPLGTLRAWHVAALVAVAAGSWLAGRWWRPAPVAGLAVAAAVVAGPWLAPAPALSGADGGSGAELWRAGGAVVVVVDDPWVPGVLAELRAAKVDRIDVLVARRGGRTVAGAVLDLRSRVPIRLVLAPAGHRILGAEVPAPGTITIGALALDVRRTRPTLEVVVRPAGAPPPPR